jgi:hypothetical protein
MTKNIIKFKATSEHVFKVRSKPVPASQMIPTWWKEMQPFTDGKNGLTLDPYPSFTAKKCFPLIDGITSGYVVQLWSDLIVSENKDKDSIARLQWTTDEPVAEAWNSKQSSGYDFPDGYSKIVFKYLHGWVIETPPGWSCLITHPLGYNNLPIKTIPAVIDTDGLNTLANSPFMIKSGFEGILEKGTPMFQIIPFKRSEWASEYELQEENENWLNMEKLKTTIVSSYGKNFRKKKKYL